MSIVHKATLNPSKPEIFGAWLATQTWCEGELTRVIGSYRFDDPAGRVGIECVLLEAGESVVHLPVSYRAAPLEGAGDFLMATTEHSVLGTRYVYDACADPVAVHALMAAALSGATQESMDVYDEGRLVERRDAVVTATGSGSSSRNALPHLGGVTIRSHGAETHVDAGSFAIVVKRLVDGSPADGDESIEVSWPGGTGSLVGVRHR
ncbi:MAG: maltokinase N-terminal cap-like domain-containing protein [Nocardioides sp.]|uniref:maltokinase N-terminal cap-like domain-containing protein n=1 Tax=Nocardioides sp. TaxID=35761 RepID=UPI003D6B692D